MVLIVKDAKRSIVCVEMERAQKFDRFQLGGKRARVKELCQI